MYACLNEFRVLEYCQMVAGPYCGKLLAELGAEVVKVESPTGDRARREGPFVGDTPHPERSCLYLYLNAGKLGITLDLESARGRDIFEQLAGSVDVLIEDTTPGTLHALGLGYDRLRELNPRLVVTSITPFGQTGPYRHYKAYHLNVYHAGGDGSLLQSGGETLHRPPMTGGGHLGDYEAGLSAAVATVAALLAGRLTRMGQHVDVSKQEALLALNRDSACLSVNGEREETRFSRRYGYGGMVPCKDGYIVAQVSESHHWEMLTRLMGNPAWAQDPQFATHQARGQHGDEVNRRIAAWAMRHTKKEIYHQALEMGCPIGLVATPEEVVHSPHAAARGLFHEVHHPAVGTGKYAGLPFVLKDRKDGCPRPAPSLGEHNRLVFGERLGYTEKELELRSRTGAWKRRSLMPRAALEGIRVAELTWVAAGPYASALLSFLGAEVIKIESRRRPDAMRRRPAGHVEVDASEDSLDASLRFSAVNLNKQSVGLDLTRPEGRALAKRIMQRSDVVIENLRPGVADRLGLGYEALSQADPDLVMVSISARGQRSPERGLPGYASIFGALGGLSHLTGYADGPPAEMRIPMDFATGTMAALAALAALLERQTTGKGQHIDLAASDLPTSFIGEVLLHYSLTGQIHSRQGNRHPALAPHNCYPCRGEDRWVTIVVATEEEWQALCQALGHPAWTSHPRFQDADSRWLHQEALDHHLAAWTRQHTPQDVMHILQGYGVAAVPSFSMLELYRDPHIQARGVFVEVDHPVLGKHMVAGAPWKLSRTPPRVQRAGPLLAEHNRPVLQGLLGLTEEEVNTLAADGVLT